MPGAVANWLSPPVLELYLLQLSMLKLSLLERFLQKVFKMKPAMKTTALADVLQFRYYFCSVWKNNCGFLGQIK